MYDLKMTAEEIAAKAAEFRKPEVYDWDEIGKNTVPDDVVTTEERYIQTGAGETHIYIHKPVKTSGEPLPLLVYLHGGGHMRGYRETDKVLNRIFAAEANCLVVDVDYHLAPEFPYPVALNECYDVVIWAREKAAELNINPDKIALAGLSAGGNLVAALAIMAKDRKGFAPLLQVLCYPVLDLDTDSLERPEGSLRTRTVQRYLRYIYIHKDLSVSKHPYVSPVYSEEDVLHGIAPALIITAEHDNIREEAEQYASNLIKAGVHVTAKRFKKSDHAFMIKLKEEYREALDLITDSLRKCFM